MSMSGECWEIECCLRFQMEFLYQEKSLHRKEQNIWKTKSKGRNFHSLWPTCIPSATLELTETNLSYWRENRRRTTHVIAFRPCDWLFVLTAFAACGRCCSGNLSPSSSLGEVGEGG